jgi:GTP-binding protein
MGKPVIVLVGRPNVGKSSLFNRMTGTRAAIVEDIPGVTRDRNYGDAECDGKAFMVVDTGGFYIDPPEDIFLQAKEQALFAIEEGDVIVQLLDGKDGLTPADLELAKVLRESGRRVIWAVNKVDAPTKLNRLYDFYNIGADELFPLSAATGYGYDEFMEKLCVMLPDYKEEKSDYPKIAVVGRPNVGKSTLVNSLLGKQRVVVGPRPGTTRDSIDSICSYHGRKYIFIDTAGLRKKGKVGYSIERFSMVRTVRSIDRCNVALVILDAGEGIIEQDQRIVGIIKKYGKGVIFLLNKWDLIENPDDSLKLLLNELKNKMWFSLYAPLLTASGLSRKRITKVFPVVDSVLLEMKKRVKTAELNKFFRNVLSDISLPTYRGRTVKMYYLTQVKEEPPSFVIFVNYVEAIKDSHIRFIENKLREYFEFSGAPIRIYVRARGKRRRK